MSMLELDQVGKSYRDGQLEQPVLSDVCLQIEPGELAVVWGLRGSGRSTLLRLAAGIDQPDTGTVRFDGRDLATDGEDILGAGIGYCQKALASDTSQTVLDIVIVSLLAHGTPPQQARTDAREALHRVGAEQCAAMRLSTLHTDETVRVAIAQVLAFQPRLIVIDDPIQGVDLLERDEVLALLRTLANDGIAVLASSGDSAALSGADRTLTLSEGALRGAPAREAATVLPLRRDAALRAGA